MPVPTQTKTKTRTSQRIKPHYSAWNYHPEQDIKQYITLLNDNTVCAPGPIVERDLGLIGGGSLIMGNRTETAYLVSNYQ